MDQNYRFFEHLETIKAPQMRTFDYVTIDGERRPNTELERSFADCLLVLETEHGHPATFCVVVKERKTPHFESKRESFILTVMHFGIFHAYKRRWSLKNARKGPSTPPRVLGRAYFLSTVVCAILLVFRHRTCKRFLV